MALAIAFPVIHVGAITVRTAGMFATPGAIFLVEGLLMVLYAKVGDRVERGAPFADVHHAGRPADDAAIEAVHAAVAFSARPVPRRRLVLGRIAG